MVIYKWGDDKKWGFGNRLLVRMAVCVGVALALTSCRDLSPTGSGYERTGDNSVIPSNLKRVSYSDLPGWRDDDVRYALQAFRNSCKAKIQYTGRVVPDRALFEEKCKNLPAASADTATVRAWFESNFQPVSDSY